MHRRGMHGDKAVKASNVEVSASVRCGKMEATTYDSLDSVLLRHMSC